MFASQKDLVANKLIKVVLVDDHKVVRHGIKMVLESEKDIRVIGEASDSIEASRLIERLMPDIVVTDLNLDGMTGFEVIRNTRECSPSTVVVVLSMHADTAYVLRALQCGARGYVLKESSSDDLTNAVRHALAGKTYLSPPLSLERVEAYRASLYSGD